MHHLLLKEGFTIKCDTFLQCLCILSYLIIHTGARPPHSY